MVDAVAPLVFITIDQNSRENGPRRIGAVFRAGRGYGTDPHDHIAVATREPAMPIASVTVLIKLTRMSITVATDDSRDANRRVADRERCQPGIGSA